MKDDEFIMIFEKDEDGRILAICPTLHGCYAKGETDKEARVNIREGIEAHIESRLHHGELIPGGKGV
jgi:predicted RNase H-like HicB family nuclease